MFCDKLSRLFASELSMSAKDIRLCLVEHLEKQVCRCCSVWLQAALRGARCSCLTPVFCFCYQERSLQMKYIGMINVNAEKEMGAAHKNELKPLWDAINTM